MTCIGGDGSQDVRARRAVIYLVKSTDSDDDK